MMQSLQEAHFVDGLLKILQADPTEEARIRAFILDRGVGSFFVEYNSLELGQDTMTKARTLGALLEAKFDEN